jgi:hypothetical protein
MAGEECSWWSIAVDIGGAKDRMWVGGLGHLVMINTCYRELCVGYL